MQLPIYIVNWDHPYLSLEDGKKSIAKTWAHEYDEWKTSGGETITGEVER